MDIVDEIKKASAKVAQKKAFEALKEVMAEGGVTLLEENCAFDGDGNITIGGKYRFTYDTDLRMVVPCPKCGMEEVTSVVRSILMIQRYYERPVFLKGHVCMDV